MEATTTRASIVIKSIPTSEILTHASMTIPLSKTRSRTSIRLVPPGVLSTAICFGSFLVSLENRAHCARIDGAHCSFKHLSHANEKLTDCDAGLSPCAHLSDCQEVDSVHDWQQPDLRLLAF